MFRMLLTTILVLMATVSFGGQVDIDKQLLTPQEKESLLAEKALLEPIIKKRVAELWEECEQRQDKLRQDGKGIDIIGGKNRQEFNRMQSQIRQSLLDFSRKANVVRKPLNEIESKLSMDKVARRAIAYRRATPQERMEVDMGYLRLQLLDQQYELDRLKEQRERGRLW